MGIDSDHVLQKSVAPVVTLDIAQFLISRSGSDVVSDAGTEERSHYEAGQ